MKTLALFVIALGSGCIVASGDDAADSAHVVVSWTLNMAASNDVTTCPPGFDTVELFSQPIDSGGNPNGTPTIDLFDCTAGTGTTVGIAETTYDEWIVITSHDLTEQFAQSATSLDQGQVIDLIDFDGAFTTEVLVDGGYFHLAWAFVGATSLQSLSCSDANVTGGIAVALTDTSGNVYNEVFPDCTVQSGLTIGLPSATYTVAVTAIDVTNAPLGTAALENEVIADPSALTPVTDLGTITIPISGM